MRKSLSFLSAIGIAFLSGGCAGDIIPQKGNTAIVTYAVDVSDLTKGVYDGDGTGAHVTRFVCEVYSGGELYDRLVNVVPEGTLSTVFKCRLMVLQDYEVLFWADSSAGEDDLYYSTSDGLKAVTLINEGAGNDDALDAFYAKDEITDFNDARWKDIVLHRPFAQLNIITEDIDDMRGSEELAGLIPDRVSLSYTGPTVFNVSSGDVSGFKNLSYTAGVYYSIGGKDTGPKYTLAMNYIFASPVRDVQEVDFKAMNADGEVASGRFSNIPLQRNYRTNVIGSILTVTSSWRVEVRPEWD